MIDPSLNELIAAHREEVHLSQEQRARARARLLAQMGMGASVSALSVGAAARTASHGASFFAKVTLGLASLGVVGGGYYLKRAEPAQVHVAPSAYANGKDAVRAAAEKSQGSNGVVEAEVAPPAQEAQSPLAPPEPARVPPSMKSAALPSQRVTLADEVRTMQEVDAAPRSGNGSRALQLLSERTPPQTGGLAEERAAARVFALCSLGKFDQGRGEAERFLRRFPRSPLAVRVRSSCNALPSAR